MSLALPLILVAFACLIAAALLWQRNKKAGVDGLGRGGIRVAIIVLMLAGVLIALASQLPMFRAS